MADDRIVTPTLLRVAVTLSIGASGGLFFAWLRTPLPWMVGAMAATILCAATGRPVAMSSRLRCVMIAVLGVMLGSVVTPEAAERIREWAVSIGVLIAYVICATGVAYLYCRQMSGYDRATAFFSAAPGGLSEMVLIAPQFGGDGRRVALVHSARVMLVVLVLPNFMQLWLGGLGAYGAGGAPILPDPTIWPAWSEMALLTGCAILGPFVAKLVRMPTAALTGPMILSALIHILGISHAQPPDLMIAIAQVVIGSAIGARFAGLERRMFLDIFKVSAPVTAILLILTGGFAALLTVVVDVPWEAALLALAPGGLSEMSLIALALEIEPAFVSFHHAIRILIIVALAPWLFSRFARHNAPKARDETG